MLELCTVDFPGGILRIVATERSDGDFHPGRNASADLAARQLTLTGTTWAMANQVHGTGVWRLAGSRSVDGVVLGPDADVLVAGPPSVPSPAAAPAMWSADCATALFVGSGGTVVGVHAGWRGLAAGVLDLALDLAAADGGIRAAVVGPMIGPCCYEFGAADLAAVAAGTGLPVASISAATTAGAPALDVPGAVTATLDRRGIAPDARAPGCTGCSGRWWSHRAAGEARRQALVGVWEV